MKRTKGSKTKRKETPPLFVAGDISFIKLLRLKDITIQDQVALDRVLLFLGLWSILVTIIVALWITQ